MESQGIIQKQRSQTDIRKVIIELTPKGKQLQIEAASIPEQMASGLISNAMSIEDLVDLKDKL